MLCTGSFAHICLHLSIYPLKHWFLHFYLFVCFLQQSRTWWRKSAEKQTAGARAKVLGFAPDEFSEKQVWWVGWFCCCPCSSGMQSSCCPAKNSERTIVTSGSLLHSSKLDCKSPRYLVTNFQPALLYMRKSCHPSPAVFNVKSASKTEQLCTSQPAQF